MTVYHGAARTLSDALRERMTGASWLDDERCPAFEELALLQVDHWGFDGQVDRGEMVVGVSVAQELVSCFGAIFAAGFPIERMRPIDDYVDDRGRADDDASMDANNASSFCFRTTPSGRLSEHAFGLAVDINPIQNPMVIGDGVWPESGRAYLERTDPRPGMIERPGPVVAAFDEIGWEWGGDWSSLKDYHHFQKKPRATR